MAKAGILPKHLSNCQVPKCSACYYGKASRRPWREKGVENKNKIATATAPGQIISVDQMQSTVPGMVGQIKGIPTRQRYHYVTVFLDQFSGLSFVHLQKTCTSEETLDAKMAFEGYACSLNVKIQHYHADNGRFCENLWMNNIKKEGQTISFCGVNAHFQNGVAERRIRDLSDGARTSLLHAKERWGKAISVHLWPYAVRHRNDVYNATRKVSKRASPIEIFSNMTIRSRLKHFHAFGCPAYRLNRDLQAGHSQPRWEQRAEPVVYLGGSPKHASSISLVLDLTTAHVSPQFHLEFDDLFETVSATRQNSQAQKSSWRQLCHFGSEKRTRTKTTALQPIDQAKEGQVIHSSQSEDLPAGVIPLDGPGQLFPAGQHEIDDGEAENSASEGEGSLIPEPPEAVVESVGRRSGRIR
jgi:hypothetical protein